MEIDILQQPAEERWKSIQKKSIELRENNRSLYLQLESYNKILEGELVAFNDMVALQEINELKCKILETQLNEAISIPHAFKEFIPSDHLGSLTDESIMQILNNELQFRKSLVSQAEDLEKKKLTFQKKIESKKEKLTNLLPNFDKILNKLQK